MSVDSGPNTVDNGLILNIDAANLRSWPGSGTTWYDVSGQTNTAYMYGSVPTSSDGGTCFDFATVSGAYSGSASLGFSFTSNMIPTTGSFTFSTWVKNPPSSVGQCGMFSNAGGGDGYRFGVGLDGCYTLVGPTYTETIIGFTNALSASLWYNVCMIFDRAGTNSGGTPQWQMYLNGVYQTASNMPSSQTASTTAAPGLVRSACCGLYTGKIATFVAYNRALSATETLQNFNALRGRFSV
jgi:hypothetical protein